MSNVIQMKQKGSLENLLGNEDFNKVLGISLVTNELMPLYKKDITNQGIVGKIAEIVCTEDENKFSKLTPQEIGGSVEKNKRAAEESYNKVKDSIYDVYLTNYVNKNINLMLEAANKNEEIKSAPKEMRDERIKSDLYNLVGRILLDSNLKANGDSDFSKLYNSFKEYHESPEKAEKSLKSMIAKKRNLVESAADGLKLKDYLNTLAMEIGREFLAEKEGKYSFDEKKFKETFENYDSGLGIARYMLLVKYARESEQEQAKAQAKGAK